MKSCYLRGLSWHQPSSSMSNDTLAARHPEWSAERVAQKTGIVSRPQAAPGETASDLAFVAAEKLIRSLSAPVRDTIDTLIFISQSPDYPLPATACLLQERLHLSTTTAAFDVNLGCSSVPYALWFVRALISSGSARKVLVLFAETYTKYLDENDLTTVTLFSDGAAAMLLSDEADGAIARIGPSRLGTDGAGAGFLIVESGGARAAAGAAITHPRLHMDGPEIFRFALDRIGPQVKEVLADAAVEMGQVDRFFFHQANRFMLEALRRSLTIAADKMPIDVEHVGNAATASLAILLARQHESAAFSRPCRSLVVGFGVGLSWGSTYVEWLPAGG